MTREYPDCSGHALLFPLQLLDSKVLRRPVESAQYASEQYRKTLKAYGLIGSMSGRGNPCHTAQAEGFMKTLNVEEVYLGEYESILDVATRLPVFIDQVYNAKHLHSSLGFVSPNQFEQSLAQLAA